MRHDTSSVSPDEHTPFVNPRALTTLATAVGLVYTLHQPVRWILGVAADVDALTARVSVLEGELARRADDRPVDDPAKDARSPRPSPATCPRFRPAARPLSCP